MAVKRERSFTSCVHQRRPLEIVQRDEVGKQIFFLSSPTSAPTMSGSERDLLGEDDCLDEMSCKATVGSWSSTIMTPEGHTDGQGRQSRPTSPPWGRAPLSSLVCANAPSEWVRHAPAEFTTAADMTSSLSAAFLLYAKEIVAEFETQSCEDTVKNSLQSSHRHSLTATPGVMSFLHLRLFPRATYVSLPSASPEGEVSRDKTLLWFMHHYREIAVTAMFMSFRFVLGLDRYGYPWLRAFELPLATLQLLASCACTLTPGSAGDGLAAFNARDQLLLISACILVSWKFADINASAENLIIVLDDTFFRQRRAINVSDILRMEAVVLRLSGLYVHTPRWWRVAVELLTTFHDNNEEWMRQTCQLQYANRMYEITSRHEIELEQLLVTSQRVLLFAMDSERTSEMSGSGRPARPHNKHHVMTATEVRHVLCDWIGSHPLFGVALAVASGAVDADWAVSVVNPAASESTAQCGGGGSTSFSNWHAALRESDVVAKAELQRMVSLLIQHVLHDETH
uniref:Uncharacterized protein n=1 Tax=Trypanosoma vivax (strain Y486) TaxID=1055687 RepID=G0U2I8_TRYVY|nr:conserved hypothetical protein [Trypanosoma vivax Y486]